MDFSTTVTADAVNYRLHVTFADDDYSNDFSVIVPVQLGSAADDFLDAVEDFAKDWADNVVSGMTGVVSSTLTRTLSGPGMVESGVSFP